MLNLRAIKLKLGYFIDDGVSFINTNFVPDKLLHGFIGTVIVA